MAALQDGCASDAAREQARTRNVDSDPESSHRDQAVRLLLQGQFAESETCSRRALALRPDDVDVLNELGVAVWRQGRAAEAEAIYLRACQIEPNDFKILT